MISSIHGLPGVGKNVYATYLAIKHYKKTNSLFSRMFRRIKHYPTYINNVYSSYPILLDKKRKVFSRQVCPDDLKNQYSFLPNSLIIIDEIQSFYDSDEYKKFPKEIAVFNQFHRHFGIQDIYYISQHPSRVVKKLRNVTCQFRKIRFFFKFPIIPFGLMYYTNYYEFDDYGKWHHPSREMKTYDCDNHFILFNVKQVFNAYDSVYLHTLNDEKPLLDKGCFNCLELSPDEIQSIFGDFIGRVVIDDVNFTNGIKLLHLCRLDY